MKQFICLIALFGLSVALNVSLDEEWTAYKLAHGKVYDNNEDSLRREIWEFHVKYILLHNLEASRGVHTHTLAMNQFGDMSNEEYRIVMNGYRMGRKTSKPLSVHQDESLEALPATVDWRTKGYVTPIKNQGQCGSCWAFSTTGSLEGQHFKKSGTLVSLSEQNLVDCSGPEGNMGCDGGLMDQAFTYIEKNKGIDTEKSYPYKARDGKCHFKKSAIGATDIGYVDIKKGSEPALQSAVATVGPIAVAIDASSSDFQLYHSGILSPSGCSSTQLDHGVLAIGYGTDGGQDYWLVKNSWGESWGMKGFFKLARNKHNMCGIATAASYPKLS